MEKADLRQQILDLQDEIVSIDEELQTFRQCARKIERRARQGRDAMTQRRRDARVRSPTPDMADTVVVLPQRQAGIEVRIPLKPRCVNAPTRPTPAECTAAGVSTRVAATSGDDSGGARQLRSSRPHTAKSSMEFQA